jgi:hypothetical protein
MPATMNLYSATRSAVVQAERLVAVGHLLDEGLGVVRELLVQQGADLEADLFEVHDFLALAGRVAGAGAR